MNYHAFFDFELLDQPCHQVAHAIIKQIILRFYPNCLNWQFSNAFSNAHNFQTLIIFQKICQNDN